MASRTQLRLSQVTGSFGTGAINDQIAAAATGSIATTDLQGVLSHLAGAIKRIHGEDSFSQNAAGEFAVTIQPSTNDGGALGGAANNWSDLYLANGAVVNFNNSNVTLTHIPDSALRLNTTMGLQFRDADLMISSSADGTLDIEADTQINIGTDRSGIAITIGNATSEVTVADNLTVTGDLTVNGTTVTVNTTNLAVEDRMIVVHKANTALASDASGTSAIAFLSGSQTADQSTIIGTADVDVIAAARMDIVGGTANPDFTNLVNFRANQFQIAGAAEYIGYDGVGDLGIFTDAGINLSASNGQIRFSTLEQEYGLVYADPSGGGRLLLSSSADKGLSLFSNDGVLTLGSKQHDVSGNQLLNIDLTTANQTGFAMTNDGTAPGNGNVRLLLKDSNDGHELSGSLKLKNASATPGQTAILSFFDLDASNSIGLKAADTIASDFTLVLPSADGTNGQVLKTNGSGVLTFGDATGDLAKGVYILTASHASGVAFPLEGNGQKTAGSDAITGLAEADSQGKSLDVFVNGQLLVSGTSGEIGANATRDYTIANSNTVAFAFNLEIDDVVQVIKR